MQFAARNIMNEVFSLQDLPQAARRLADFILSQPATVIALHGGMGAGKTTLAGATCHALGSSDVTGSPTYSIINEYDTAGGQKIYHMDWYRLNDEAEAIDAGIEDALYSGYICLVEWPEKAAGLLPDNTIHLELKPLPDGLRQLSRL